VRNRTQRSAIVDVPSAYARQCLSRSHLRSQCHLFALTLSLLAAVPDAMVFAQDGVIIARDTVHISADLLSRAEGGLAVRGHDASDVAGRVVISRIAYMSDGLRVSGYLVEPRDGVGSSCRDLQSRW
jgi:hypothetical protein